MDIKDVTVLKPTDRHVEWLGEIFTDEFIDYAKSKSKSYILLQYPKGHPEDSLMDTANVGSQYQAEEDLKKIFKCDKEEK